MDVLAGRQIAEASQFPLYHRGAIGPLPHLDGSAGFAVICIGIDPRWALPQEDVAELDRLGVELVRIVPPDGDGDNGYCDLDLAYTALMANDNRDVMIIRPGFTVIGSSADSMAEFIALVDRLRDELTIATPADTAAGYGRMQAPGA